jgi:hypothetical protein
MLSRLYRRLPSGFINYQNFKIMSYQNISRSRNFICKTPLFLFLFLVFLFACKDENKKQEEPKPAQEQQKPKTDSTTADLIKVEDFPVVCILKKDIDDLFKKRPHEPAVFKLVFTFNLDDAKPSNPSLTAYRAKSNDALITKDRTTLERNETTYKITGEYNLGNLELTKHYYETKIKAHPDYASADRLLFYPYYDKATYSILYHLVWAKGECKVIAPDIYKMAPPLAPAGELNPCPPNQPGT